MRVEFIFNASAIEHTPLFLVVSYKNGIPSMKNTFIENSDSSPMVSSAAILQISFGYIMVLEIQQL